MDCVAELSGTASTRGHLCLHGLSHRSGQFGMHTSYLLVASPNEYYLRVLANINLVHDIESTFVFITLFVSS